MIEWFREYPLITFLIIFALITYVYNKVFKTRRLPVLKEAIIYFMLALGAGMLLMFQLGGLPIIPSLSVAVVLMLIYKIRTFVQERAKKQ